MMSEEIMGGVCPYCRINMTPTGHSSGLCNGWLCPKCGHEDIESGSWSLAGRPDPIGECQCRNCKAR